MRISLLSLVVSLAAIGAATASASVRSRASDAADATTLSQSASVTACPSYYGTINYCNGKGTCRFRNNAAFCECQTGYVGDTCEQECPGQNGTTVCSGHGTCAKGDSGAVCTCAPGYLGADCSQECPGRSVANGNVTVCNNHGSCFLDANNRAICVCKRPSEEQPGVAFVGPSCNLACPKGVVGGSGQETVCSSKGDCRFNATLSRAECVCDPRHIGESCSVACLLGDAVVNKGQDTGKRTCNDQGRCVLNGTDAAACNCSLGYRDRTCSQECPGHVTVNNTAVECYGNGDCGLNSTNQIRCDCYTGFHDTDCAKVCPGHNGVRKHASAAEEKQIVCSGHGLCSFNGANPGCACDFGYRRFDCAQRCPGFGKNSSGIDVECSGQGTCELSSASDPNALAQCRCKDGFVGYGCESQCPGNSGSTVCSGHGTCRTNVGGCLYASRVCTNSSASGVVCDCAINGVDTGFRGPACDKNCPRHTNGTEKVCNGRGTCVFDAANDRAVCQCDKGWKGDSCETVCPGYSESFNSTLNKTVAFECTDNGQCSLDGSSTICSCGYRFTGAACENTCPGHVQSELVVCSGFGLCATSKGDAICQCNTSRVGHDCSKACPGSVSRTTACSGHGLCYSNWEGCPSHTATVTCNSQSGVKDSSPAYCSCSLGYIGGNCSQICPGYGASAGYSDSSVCSGHGACSANDTGSTGKCTCRADYVGTDCKLLCPGSTVSGNNVSVCTNGQGTCRDGTPELPVSSSSRAAKCDCRLGFLATDCSVQCPGVLPSSAIVVNATAANSSQTQLHPWSTFPSTQQHPNGVYCYGHGNCSLASGGSTAGCTCDYGYRGSACSQLCPGHTAAQVVCHGNGVCGADAACTCALGYQTDNTSCSVEPEIIPLNPKENGGITVPVNRRINLQVAVGNLTDASGATKDRVCLAAKFSGSNQYPSPAGEFSWSCLQTAAGAVAHSPFPHKANGEPFSDTYQILVPGTSKTGFGKIHYAFFLISGGSIVAPLSPPVNVTVTATFAFL